MESDFSEDTVAKINPMVEILGGGKHQFVARDIAGIDVYRSFSVLDKRKFERVGLALDSGKAVAWNKIFKDVVRLQETFSHLLFVIVRKVKRNGQQ